MLQKVSFWRKKRSANFALLILLFLVLSLAGAQETPSSGTLVQAANLKPDLLTSITIAVNGSSVGDKEVGILGDSPILSRELLIELLGDYLKPDIYDTVFNVVLSKLDWVSESELKLVGIGWEWDMTHVVLTLTVPTSYGPITDLDTTTQYVVNIKPILKPVPVSGHLDFSFNVESDVSQSKTEFPIEANIDGIVNVLGWVADVSGTLDLSDDVFTPTLNNARIVHDFPGINGRLTVGKVTALGLAYQSQPDLYALSLNSAEIVKYKVKPGFYELFSEFTIEKPSTVRIMLNNTTYRTITLNPGNYRVLDLPFTNGLNDFTLEIEDPDGNITTRKAVIPREMDLLGESLSEYSMTAGVGRIEITQPLVTGYYRYGFSPRFTAGLQAEADLRSVLGGASFVFASSIGSFTGTGVGIGAWDGRSKPFTWAASLQYRLSIPGEDYIPTIGLSAEYKSQGFAIPNPSTTVSEADENLRLGAQVGGMLSAVMSYSVSGTWARTFGSSPLSTTNINASLNRSLGAGASLSFLCNLTLKENSAPSVTFTAMVFVLPKAKAGRSLSFIQSGDSANSLSYVDKVDALGGIDLNLRGTNLMIGTTTGSSIGISGRKTEDWGEMALSADMDYGNSVIGTTGKFVATGSTSLAFAGGYFAFTRQLDDSFVLFAPQKGMASQKVYFKVDGAGTVTSENGRPVILPLTSYKTTAAYLELPDAPPDITPTVEAALLVPGYESAILFTADTQKRYQVTGTLVNDAGVPYGYVAGDLVDAGGTNLSSTFTDETGQFELYDLEPGTYTILWPDFVGISKVEVKATESGIIELGSVVPAPVEQAAP